MYASPLLPLLLLFASGCVDGSRPEDTDTDTDTGTDSDTDTDTDTAGLNTAPGAPTVAIDPAAPNELAELEAVIVTESVDAEGDAVSYRYSWTQNGAERADLDQKRVGAAETVDGDTWVVTVHPSDGALEGASATSTVTVGNLPPTPAGIHFEPVAPVSGDDLTLVFDIPANDANGDVLTQTIVWYFNGAKNISFDGKTSVDGVYVDGGDSFRVVVSVTDGLSDPVVVEASVEVANTMPEVTSVTITPTDPGDADDLLCTPRATDADGGTLTYIYTWYRDGIEAADIGNDDTVSEAVTVVGESWECEVEASDGFLAATLRSSAVEISPPTGYRITSNIEMTVTEDTAGAYSATGAIDWDIYMTGGRYTTNDCFAVWSILAAEDNHCRGCTYSFSGAYTYDAALSTIVSGCSSIATDSVGDIDYDARSGSFNASLDDASWERYAYYGSGYPVSFSERGSGGAAYSYYGYTSGHYYSVVETADAYGNVVLTGYSTRYTYY